MYLLAFIPISLRSYIITLPLMLLIAPLMEKKKSILPIIIIISEIASNFIAIYIIVIICNALSVKPTFLMLFLPYIIPLQNDFKNLEKSKTKAKNITSLEFYKEMQNWSPEYRYDTKIDIRIDYAHLIGDVIGLLLGSIYFLRGAKLF